MTVLVLLATLFLTREGQDTIGTSWVHLPPGCSPLLVLGQQCVPTRSSAWAALSVMVGGELKRGHGFHPGAHHCFLVKLAELHHLSCALASKLPCHGHVLLAALGLDVS